MTTPGGNAAFPDRSSSAPPTTPTRCRWPSPCFRLSPCSGGAAVRLYLVDGGISEPKRRLLERVFAWSQIDLEVRWIRLDADTDFTRGLPEPPGYILVAANYRPLAPYFVPEPRVLYLDSDVVVRRDLRSVFGTNIAGYAVAVVVDTSFPPSATASRTGGSSAWIRVGPTSTRGCCSSASSTGARTGPRTRCSRTRTNTRRRTGFTTRMRSTPCRRDANPRSAGAGTRSWAATAKASPRRKRASSISRRNTSRGRGRRSTGCEALTRTFTGC